MRNPVYLSYLLTEISTIVLWTPVVAEYALYKTKTGRLLPRW